MTDLRGLAVGSVVAQRGVLPEAVEVVRERQHGDMAAVAYLARRRSDGSSFRGFAGLRRREDGIWRSSGGWSSGAPDGVGPEALWAAWGGWGSGQRGTPDVGVRGGWVADPTAALVRLTDPSGRVVEDRVEAGVAILIWDQGLATREAVVELVDADGAVLRRALLERS
ncbi:hypothetical protein [Nocardioides lianchengensis]|uniref:Uncharacterized protein n=1 Tax=Nocardioides lianchengensis TaxID=1045774 RepID=A0A1G6R0V8_9ACTN|nr:hypothetical protein [Nocardioides lianchengensis]SDC98188.1 hypothetical protein SAMN05421872_105107 [Nocardioides lianchengensis]